MKIELIVNPDALKTISSAPRLGPKTSGVSKAAPRAERGERSERGDRKAGRGGKGKRVPKKAVTGDDLDAEMDAYMADEVKIV